MPKKCGHREAEAKWDPRANAQNSMQTRPESPGQGRNNVKVGKTNAEDQKSHPPQWAWAGRPSKSKGEEAAGGGGYRRLRPQRA